MKEYAEYFSSIDRARARVDSLMQVSLSNNSSEHTKELYIRQFRSKLEECSSKSKFGKYKLTDLMGLPYQRVLKYHLLFSELLKQTDVDHRAKDVIKKTKDSMCELGNYLNECQRDKENLSKIEFLIKFLLINNNSSETARSSLYSTSFNLNLLKDYGHYIKDDKFRIKSIDSGERYARTRTFFLFEKALIVCKLKGNYYNYKETLLINDFSIEDHYQTNLSSQSSSNLPHGLISNLFNSSNLNSTANLSTSSLNLNSSSNAHSLHLINQEHSKIYLIIFKNKEHKKEWKECLLKAKEKMRPEGQRALKHLFELTNFDRELVTCCVCNKYLLGLFYQGYKCSQCSSIAHKECLTKVTSTCSSFNSLPMPAPLLPRPVSNSGVTITRSLSTNSAKSNYNQTLLAQAIYNYDGRPAPPEGSAVSFNQGDLIQVTDDDDDDWWKGVVVAKNKEGYFPRRHVRVMQNHRLSHSLSSGHLSRNLNLEEYPWFSPVDRFMADAILNRIPNDLSETIFMVRCRNDGGYAISIKHKGIVDHIKININELSNSSLAYPLIINDSAEDEDFTHVYFIDQQHNFNSIVSLVKYFSAHLLKDNFPQLDSTLGIPFKKALPPYISVAVAKHDYSPPGKDNIGEQIELKVGKKYYLLSEEVNGWLRVYNSDGLIGYVPGSYLSGSKDLIES
ncbi:guanine nucleotide exchange factor VAV2 isoform X6 [Brachionus plicatilis]|uniref:Guanine nucleotide exchange factor VAV2 isoform X6 n=1 Tax=Brachionus plicatilis TaxID=10195 RepID=A0A3M7PCJ2_BRAPC|nr:guanine nucleotide exchange factor VAV2 isoform X6 [Brachionus plicatilis]